MFDDFKPDAKKSDEVAIPFFDDCLTKDGWEGHTTGKDIPFLVAEITSAIFRLGGEVISVMRGRYGERLGVQIVYSLIELDGTVRQGRLDICALPIRRKATTSIQSDVKRAEQSLKMALFNMRDILDGLWRLQFLSPGYSALMPWMLTNNGQTVSQVWNSRRILPVPEEAFERRTP